MADNLIGLEPNQIPVHAHFGGLAYQQPNTVNITGGTIGGLTVEQLVTGASGTVKSVAGKSPDGNGNVVLVAGDVGAVATSGGTITGSLRVLPPPMYWTAVSSFFGVGGVGGSQMYGQLDHHGAFSTTVTSNGYRNNSNEWVSYAAGGGTGAAQIELRPDGEIRLRTEAIKESGSSSEIPIRVQINDTVFKYNTNDVWHAGNFSPATKLDTAATAVTLVTQAIAELGVDTSVRGWSALRVRQAINARVSAAGISGSYADLSNKPTIPAAQVNADWSASSGIAQILNKPSTMSQAEAEAGTATAVRMLTAQRVRQSTAAYAYSKAEIDAQMGDVESALDAILGV